ncbi:MAG: peptide chain release factor N(5)-glutamine methyltransferase [Dissulfuribacterales bacterium]
MQEIQPIDIKHVLSQAVLFWPRDSFIENPRLEAEILLCDTLSVERAWLYAHSDHLLTAEQLATYKEKIHRRRSGEPIAYITGRKEFWSLEFKVTPNTLIPRPETELLVETALQIIDLHFPNENFIDILDIGTGSGAIAVALTHERPNIRAVATDISFDALKVACENAVRHGVRSRMKFVCADCMCGLKACNQFHIILSNPPYISHEERNELPSEVLDYEPALALFSDEDGLRAIRLIVSNAGRFLRQNGHLLCEIGWKQGEKVIEIAGIYFDQQARIIRDYSGRDRVLAVQAC